MEYISGDLTLETSGLIIHGVNAQGKMGSGIALAIRNKWPEVYTAYANHPQGKVQLGNVQFVSISDGLYVGNCWTQEFYGKDGKIYADKNAVKVALEKAFDFCSQYKLELKSPKIAAGLGGLSWEEDVLPIFNKMQNLYPDVKVKIFEFGC